MCAEASQKLVNLAEKTAFMNGTKKIASECEMVWGCGCWGGESGRVVNRSAASASP